MKKSKGRGVRLARRCAALAVGAAVLRGAYLALPELSADRAQKLGQALLTAELGEPDEQALLEQLLRGETTLYDAAEETGLDEFAAAVPSAPAGDTTVSVSESAPAQAEPAPEPETPAEQDGGTAVARTMTANENTVTGGGVEINNSTKGISVDAAALAESALTQRIAPASEGPQILIMHTHATEAYTMAGDDIYTESDTARTTDENFNMIRVGEEMKAVFESMGFSVLHDKTLYDYPGYNGSYGRSLAGIQAILAEYPSISVVLDVHRDALIAQDGTVYKAVTEVDGVPTAQVMLVAGSNDGGLTHPDWQENLALAAHIQLAMRAIEPTLCRPINLRSQRFNQHLTPCSLLVEVGTSGNTLQEALAGARYFAQAAGSVYQGVIEE